VREVGIVVRVTEAFILNPSWAVATRMERAVFAQCAALRTLRDGSAFFSNVKERAIVVRAIGGAVAADAVVTTRIRKRQSGAGDHANLWSTFVTGSV
jgi:hypothetical protein